MDVRDDGVNYTTAAGQDPFFEGSNGLVNFINIVNLIICAAGMGGNILVFYVVCRFSAMWTVTNIFILALSLADIAFLIHIPFLIVTALLGSWIFGDFYCKVYYVCTTVNQFASSFFLVTMSADRYFAVCLPVFSRKIRTLRKAVLACCAVWCLAIVFMCPVFLYYVTKIEGDQSSPNCNIYWPDFYEVEGAKMFALYCSILGFALPACLMLLFYGLVLKKLRMRHHNNSNGSSSSQSKIVPPPSDDRRRSKLRRVSALIFVLVLAFLICWTPYWSYQLHITFTLTDEVEAESEGEMQTIYLALFLQCLCYAHSAINPVLYSVVSKNFKQCYAKAVKCGKRPQSRSTSVRRSHHHPEENHFLRAPAAHKLCLSSSVRSDVFL